MSSDFVACIRQLTVGIKHMFESISFRFYFSSHQAVRGVPKAVETSIRISDTSQMV